MKLALMMAYQYTGTRNVGIRFWHSTGQKEKHKNKNKTFAGQLAMCEDQCECRPSVIYLTGTIAVDSVILYV